MRRIATSIFTAAFLAVIVVLALALLLCTFVAPRRTRGVRRGVDLASADAGRESRSRLR